MQMSCTRHDVSPVTTNTFITPYTFYCLLLLLLPMAGWLCVEKRKNDFGNKKI